MRSRVLCLMACLGLCAFWAGLYAASRHFPSEYDWRYMTISSLLYPDRDPRGYIWAWGGLIACASGGLCWVSVQLRDAATEFRSSRFGLWAVTFGYLCMVGCAIWPGRLLHLPRGHDLLALLAFIGICVGTVPLTYQTVAHALRRRRSLSPAGTAVIAGVVAAAVLLPLFFEAVTQADVERAFPHLPWVGLEWRARGVPVHLSFAFWEWITCAMFSVYLAGLSLTSVAWTTPARDLCKD